MDYKEEALKALRDSEDNNYNFDKTTIEYRKLRALQALVYSNLALLERPVRVVNNVIQTSKEIESYDSWGQPLDSWGEPII